ncbi:MAG: MBL fold metallo-hydrolase, partial [Pseudomonadota bacterium]
MTLNRRTFLASSAAAGVASIAQAEAPMLGAAQPTFRRIKLGAFEVSVISDGVTPASDPKSF